MTTLPARLQAVTDLMVPTSREWAGLHAYDGVVQDLSPAGVRLGLQRLAPPTAADTHDEAHLAAFEETLRVRLGKLQMHRRNPLLHLDNLDLSVYDREYAPSAQRDAAKEAHLAAWPDAVDAALESLDRVPAPVAAALLPAFSGLAAGLTGGTSAVVDAALAAHERLLAHMETAAREGDPDPALGEAELTELMGSGEAVQVDLGELAQRCDDERKRMSALLEQTTQVLLPDLDTAQAVSRLLDDHPQPDEVLDVARELTAEALQFTAERDLMPHLDGECLVGAAPESRRWAMAMMSTAAPHEDEGPSWYHVTPPDTAWPELDQKHWLEAFSHTTLPAITVHEVAPGHYAHGRSLRRAPSLVRRTLFSDAFVEGWAHYAEELCLEEGFRAEDPRFAAGVAIEALVRVTRLSVAIGVHTGALTVDEATAQFERDAFLSGPAARSEAVRATFDPTYGRYTWGKLAIVDLRDQARSRWGSGFTLRRFHDALMALGSPPLGLLGAIFEQN